MPDNKKELMVYRMAGAKEKLNSSKLLLNNGNYKDSIGRSYYAMFSAVRAILALDGVDYSKHAGVIAYFQKEYVKTGRFDKLYSKYLSQAFQIRNQADYEDFYIVSPKCNAALYSRQKKHFIFDSINTITAHSFR